MALKAHWAKRSLFPPEYTNVASSYIYKYINIYRYHYIIDLLYISAIHALFLNVALWGQMAS